MAGMQLVRTLALVFLVLSCGGGKASAPPPADPPPPPTEEPLTHEQHVAELEDLAVRGCACADAACIAAVDADLAEVIGAVAIASDPMPEAETNAGGASLGRYLDCMNELGAEPEASFHSGFVARLHDVRDAACACHELACVIELWGGLAAEWFAIGTHLSDKEAFSAKVRPIMKQIGECLEPVSQQLAAEAVVELTALRDASCACRDTACADDIQTRFDEFLMKHRATQGNEEQAITIGALAKEMSACLETVRGTAPAAK